MSSVNGNAIRAVLQLTGVIGADSSPTIRREPSYGDEERFHISGTPGYLAPEVWQGAPPTEASDFFAFGVTARYYKHAAAKK